VNHRYLDVQFRLPEELRPQEIALRSLIADVLNRGKVECSMHLRRRAGKQGELSLNRELLAEIAARVEELSSLIPALQPLDPLDLLRWPGVVLEPEIDAEPLLQDATAILYRTLDALQAMRSSEGERIGIMLQTRMDDILAIAGRVRARMPDVLAAVRAKQHERLSKLDVEADPARLETELALMAQKLDVDEELDRLESHIQEVRSALQAGEAVGRRLDFLMQELNREANTLGSKSADAETTNAAVDLKVLVEQMREQIQNIE
jgi:uncharacterized protein (TIGR00255 family)